MSGEPSASVDERQVSALVRDLGQMIESARHQVAVAANAALATLYWRLGHGVLAEILQGRRTDYGAQIVAAVRRQLEARYGRGFERTAVSRKLEEFIRNGLAALYEMETFGPGPIQLGRTCYVGSDPFRPVPERDQP